MSSLGLHVATHWAMKDSIKTGLRFGGCIRFMSEFWKGIPWT